MSRGLLFWVIYIICVLAGLYFYWPAAGMSWHPLGGGICVFLLLGILGWKVFGPIVHD